MTVYRRVLQVPAVSGRRTNYEQGLDEQGRGCRWRLEFAGESRASNDRKNTIQTRQHFGTRTRSALPRSPCTQTCRRAEPKLINIIIIVVIISLRTQLAESNHAKRQTELIKVFEKQPAYEIAITGFLCLSVFTFLVLFLTDFCYRSRAADKVGQLSGQRFDAL